MDAYAFPSYEGDVETLTSIGDMVSGYLSLYTLSRLWQGRHSRPETLVDFASLATLFSQEVCLNEANSQKIHSFWRRSIANCSALKCPHRPCHK